MQIKCLTTFLDGTRRFEKGDTVTVDDADGARFVEEGWAESSDGAGVTVATDAAPAALTINKGTLGSTANLGD